MGSEWRESTGSEGSNSRGCKRNRGRESEENQGTGSGKNNVGEVMGNKRSDSRRRNEKLGEGKQGKGLKIYGNRRSEAISEGKVGEVRVGIPDEVE